MTRIRTIIVDDEPLAREGIRVLLQRDQEIEIIGTCGNGFDAVEMIQYLKPDLLFLDVQMPEIDGFGVLQAVKSGHMPVVIFVTAYDKHALRAFEVHALDYLLKSYTDERFTSALQRAKDHIRQKKVNEISQRLLAMLDSQKNLISTDEKQHRGTEPYLKRLVVKSGGRVFFLKAEEIDWIEAADYYVRLHVGGKSHLLRETMNALERKLNPEKFQRIHRSTIISLDRIKEMQPFLNGDYVVTLRDGTELKMSRSYRPKIEAALGGAI